MEFTPGSVPDVLPLEVSLCLYRVIQEGLRNIAKHARARHAQISLGQDNGGLRLIIQDDGLGFDPASYAVKRDWVWPACGSGFECYRQNCWCTRNQGEGRASRSASPWSEPMPRQPGESRCAGAVPCGSQMMELRDFYPLAADRFGSPCREKSQRLGRKITGMRGKCD